MKDSCGTADMGHRKGLARAGGAVIALAATVTLSLGIATGSASVTASTCPVAVTKVTSLTASGCLAKPMNVRWQ